jgi:hypothetical protein
MERVRPVHLESISYICLLGGYMGFDYQFTQLLRLGDIAAAKNLLIKKYPHLRQDSDRTALYIRLYQNHYRITILGDCIRTKSGQNKGAAWRNFPVLQPQKT